MSRVSRLSQETGLYIKVLIKPPVTHIHNYYINKLLKKKKKTIYNVFKIHPSWVEYRILFACVSHLEMYEISPYATFSVNGGRTGAPAKTPTRAVAAQTPLDYTMQFKTFGHPEGENLNATAYPLLPSSGFGHVKSKSSWHKQRYYNTEGEWNRKSKIIWPYRFNCVTGNLWLYKNLSTFYSARV